MTEDEVKKILIILHEKIPSGIGWFLMLRDNEKSIFLGDLCP